MTELPAVRFLRTLCAAVLRDTPPADAAARAHEALRELWTSRRSLVLEVQFTGFLAKGERIGGVEPAFLRGAGQLIVHRVSLVGFTPDAREEDLATLIETAARPPAELGAEGIVGAMRAAAPRGIYVSTSTGQVYKPAPAPAAEAPPPAAPHEPGVPAIQDSPPLPTAAPETDLPVVDVSDADTSNIDTSAVDTSDVDTSGVDTSGVGTTYTEVAAPSWNSGFTLELDDSSELSSFEIIEDDV
ncbi:MAG TPA: hypothetical protein VK420_20690, partial [Longimicrobium sp.]|nr:hypothetical protein [Longimicrobium sp.]